MFKKYIKYNNSDVIDEFNMQYYDCEFVKDFGIWQKGYKTECLNVDYAHGIVTEYSVEGEEKGVESFTIVPV